MIVGRGVPALVVAPEAGPARARAERFDRASSVTAMLAVLVR